MATAPDPPSRDDEVQGSDPPAWDDEITGSVDMLEAISIELNRLFPGKYNKSGPWTLPLVHVINDHIIHYTDLPVVRVGFDLAQDKPLKVSRNNDTEVVDAKDVFIEGVDNLPEFLDNQKNVPQLPETGEVCIEKRASVRDRLYNYIKNFKDYAYVGVIETDELVIEEVDEAQDVYDVL